MNKTILVTAFLAACLGLAGGYLLALQPSNNTPTPAVQSEKKPVLSSPGIRLRFSGNLISKRFTAEKDYVSEYGFEN